MILSNNKKRYRIFWFDSKFQINDNLFSLNHSALKVKGDCQDFLHAHRLRGCEHNDTVGVCTLILHSHVKAYTPLGTIGSSHFAWSQFNHQVFVAMLAHLQFVAEEIPSSMGGHTLQVERIYICKRKATRRGFFIVPLSLVCVRRVGLTLMRFELWY